MAWQDNKAVDKADTYGNLVDACLKGGDSRTAIKICEVLEEEAKKSAPPQPTPPPQQPNPQAPYYGGNAQPPPPHLGYQAPPSQNYGPPGAYQPYGGGGGGQPQYHPPQQQQQQQNQQQWVPQQHSPPQQQQQQHWAPQQQQQGTPPQQQQQQWALQQHGPPQQQQQGPPQQQQQQHWAPQQHEPPQQQQQQGPPQQQPYQPFGQQPPNSGPGQGPTSDSALNSGEQQQSSAAIDSVSSTPQSLQQQPVAMFDYFEKGTVDSDGGNKVMQYEAMPRGQHVPQLKLDYDDQISVIHAKPLHVSHQVLGYYPMNNVLHGVALIINNQHFTDVNYRERVDTARDEYNLKQTFLFLGYRPVVCTDLTKAEITYIFKNLDHFLEDSNKKAQNKVANDSFVCCILSHGYMDVFFGSDSQALNREDIEITVGASKILQDKPKIFFMQVSQGCSPGTVAVPRIGVDNATSVLRADFYFYFGSAYGEKTYRDKFRGSWFITKVCKVLCEYATTDIMNNEFQLRLNRSMTDVYRYHREVKTYTQRPNFSNQLQKSVHFFLGKQSKDSDTKTLAADSNLESLSTSESEPISSDSDIESLSRSEAEFCASIEKHLKSSGTIDRFLAHLVFVGLPASGKTTLIARLLNLKVTMEAFTSTGVMDGIITVSIGEDRATMRAANVDEQTSEKTFVWHKVEFNLSCLRQMGMLSVSQPSEYTGNCHGVIASHEEIAAEVDSTPADHSHAGPDHTITVADQPVLDSVVCDQAQDDTTLQETLEAVETPIQSAPAEKGEDFTVLLAAIESILKEKGYSAEGFSKIRPFLKNKTTLYLSDTGGQIEFQELLPLLIAGYAIFLFLFPLNKDLNKPVRVSYRKKDGGAINIYTSTLTIEESFLQTLSSIDSMLSSNDPTAAKDNPSQLQHDPAVFVIGTHKDCLIKQLQSESAAEEEIARIDHKIKSLVEEYGYGDLVMHADRAKKEILFAVDNTCENDVFKKIRSRIMTFIREKKKFQVKFPLSYLLASMHLEGKSGPFIKRSDFAKDIIQYGIEEEDVDHLLHFLHTRIGQIRYFPLKEIEEDIVKEPQALYDIVTDLVIESFWLPSNIAQDSEVKRGIYSFRSFEKHSHVLEPKKIIALLTALRIVAPFKSSKEEKYFIPCILNHLEKPPRSKACETSGIQPLAILFSCGHCPKGMFGVLLHYILTQDDNSLDWKLIENEIFRDQVSFKVGAFRNKVTIKFHTMYLEVEYCPTSVALHDPVSTEKKICNKICSVLVSGIEEATRSLRYSPEKTKFSFGLVCTKCGSAHEVTKGYTIECPKQASSALPNSGSFWFKIPTYSFSGQVGGGTILLKEGSNPPKQFFVSSESSCSQHTLTKIEGPTHRTNHVYLEQNTIIFKDILECDKGVYRVSSCNDVGSGQMSFKLKLKRPTKYKFLQRYLKGVAAGSSPTLEFSVDPPVPEDTVHSLSKENGEAVPPWFEVKHDRVVFQDLEEGDSGKYIISCRDTEGELVEEILWLKVMSSQPSNQHAPATYGAAALPGQGVQPLREQQQPAVSRTVVESCHYSCLMRQLSPYAREWESIAEGLDFHQDEIESIKAEPEKMTGGNKFCLRAMLSQWTKWAKGDARGSKDRATLEALKGAVSGAGYPQVANELSLTD